MGDDPKNESILLMTCASWFDPALADRFHDLLLSGPFETTWRATSVDAEDDAGDDDADDADDADERPVVRVSCAVWETTCVLARVIVVDLRRAMTADTPSEERKRRARRIVACSREAIDTLERWWKTGNGRRWLESGVDVPLEANVVYFQTTRLLGEILHDLACVDTITEPSLVCHKSFTQVALDIASRANEMVERASVDAPRRVHDMASATRDAIVASVAEKIVRAAFQLKTLRKPCVAWCHVAAWKRRRLERIDSPREEIELSTLRQFARTTILEAHDERIVPATPNDAWGAPSPDYSFRPDELFSM